MKKLTTTTQLTLVAGLFLATAGSVFATVTLTGASGGGNISADTASNAPSSAWTTLGAITITEGASTDFTNGTAVTLILRTPAGFQFNTAVTPNVTFTASKNITSASVAMTDSSNITVMLTVSGTAVATDSLTIGSTTGIQVRPTASLPLVTGNHIYRPSTGGGTAGIKGITNSANGSDGSSFGTLTEAPGTASSTMPSQTQILSDMILANNYFTNNWPTPGCTTCLSGGHPSTIWTRGTYFEGSLAMWRINPDPAITNYATRWGAFTNWTIRYGATDTSSDDQCAGSEYIELYQLNTTQTNRITNIVANLTYWMTNSSGTKTDWWYYIDCVHMSGPAFAKMAAISGGSNTNYAAKMYSYWNYAKSIIGPSNGLYNLTNHLWVRDTNFLANYKASDGTTTNCYWSRGNGWVFAGLARIMDVLPSSDAHFLDYSNTFIQMATALKPIQRSDGFWNMNLAYTNDYPGPESSGTALFTYGLAWGIHHRYLDAATYLPTVIKGWNALSTSALHHSPGSDPGFIGFVQSTGSYPTNTPAITYTSIPDFDDFTLGALLLAGSELYQLTNLSQTITNGSLSSHTYGDTPITLNASASSGLPVSFSLLSGPASLAGNTLTITGAGTVVVQASQAGNANYAATNVNLSFVVNPAALTVSANPTNKVYGATDPVLTWRITSGALVGNDAVNGLLARVTGEHVGGYAIQQGTLTAGTNYTLTFVTANLTILQKAITVTADSKSKAYGDGDPALTYQITSGGGLVTGDNFSGSLSRAAGENVGNYAIAQNSLTAGTDYNLTFVGANLAINPKAIAVTADPKSKVYGDADPALTYQITGGGLVTGDNFTGGLARAMGENVGAHAILQSTLTAGANYNLAYNGANLTISQKAITVTADNKSKTQGLANPLLTASYNGFIIGENTNALTTQVTLTTAADVNSPAGTTYPIAASGAAAANYTISYVAGILTVVERPDLTGISASGDQYTVTWPTIASQNYQVEFKDNLEDPTWTLLGNTVAGTGDPLNVTNNNNLPHRFYRVMITQP
jgi:rhamnogalacturonyl hydrolase YesR